MTKVYIVLAEYPFDGRFIVRAFSNPADAEEAAAEIVNDILEDFWPIYDDDHTMGPRPEATRLNFEELVEQYGNHEEVVQGDRWGAWEVVLRPTELET